MEIKVKQRIALSSFFFLYGLSFSSWASRIPTIKDTFDFNEAELGSVLFIMPISSLIGLPVSGWLVEKLDSRYPILWGVLAHLIFLFMIGISHTVLLFSISVAFFAFFTRIMNVAVNTQAINLQKKFTKKINGSFHGLWSFGGIAGVGVTTLMIAFDIDIITHFIIISSLASIATIVAYQFLLKNDKTTSPTKLSFKKPDPMIMLLGVVILCAAICEGGMFDWSGIYFKEVVKVEIFSSGYLIFMTSMAFSRFVSDWAIHKLGMRKLFIISGSLIAFGLALAIIFPNFWMAMIGFVLVGAGTASVVPMTFTLAGSSTKYSPGMAISLIGTYGMVGMLLGPPLIGYIAHLLDLRASFVFLAISGLTMIPVSGMIFKRIINSGRSVEEL